jgi:hypothetical protein
MDWGGWRMARDRRRQAPRNRLAANTDAQVLAEVLIIIEKMGELGVARPEGFVAL